MAVGQASLGLGVMAGANNPLTGTVRRDFIRMKMFDKTGKSSWCVLEMTKASGWKANDVVDKVQAVSSGVMKTIQLVIDITDYRFNPRKEAPSSSNVKEFGVFKFQTEAGIRSFKIPSIRDELVGSGGALIVDPGQLIGTDNPVQNIIDEVTGRGVFNRATILVANKYGETLDVAYRQQFKSKAPRQL